MVLAESFTVRESVRAASQGTMGNPLEDGAVQCLGGGGGGGK